MRDDGKLDRRIGCLINNNAFEGLKIGHYRDENGQDQEDPNVLDCTHFYRQECIKPDNMAAEIVKLLGHVDFVMGCNGEKNVIDHVKRLVEYYGLRK